MTIQKPDIALIVDDEIDSRLNLKSLLIQQGYETIEAANGQQAIDLFHSEKPDIIFMDTSMPEVDGYEASRLIKAELADDFIPIIFLPSEMSEEALGRCVGAGGDDFLVKPFDKVVLKTKIMAMKRISALNKKVQGMYSMIHREQEIAESVFINAIQGTNIKNPSIYSKIRPAGTFSGDMILSAYSPSRDLYFLIGDFTGHGLSAAIGAMPVSEVFHAMTSKGFSPESILLAINKKLKTLLPVGMFFGAQMVVVKQELEHALIFNAGMPDLMLIDGSSNKIKKRFKSRGLPLGIVSDMDVDSIVEFVPIVPGDKILMFSDGLIEARNSANEEFGETRLINAIEAANGNQIYDQIFADLETFIEGMTLTDDVTLAKLVLVESILPQVDSSESHKLEKKASAKRGEWQLTLNFNGARLKESNPVPIIVNHILEMEDLEMERQSLFTVMTELYVNALDHGVLGLNSDLKSSPTGFAQYFEERQLRLNNLDSGFVNFDLAVEQVDNYRSIILRVEDSGKGFDYRKEFPPIENESQLCGRGILLVRNLCESLAYEGEGNIARASFRWETS